MICALTMRCSGRRASSRRLQGGQAARRLRRAIPRGFELIYDNYNALVIGFSPTERTSDAVVSVAAYPKWITLFFLKGATLNDPAGLLQGVGSTVRSVRLKSPSDLGTVPLATLLRTAITAAKPSFAAAPRLNTIVKSVSKKQRPRMAVEKARARRARVAV